MNSRITGALGLLSMTCAASVFGDGQDVAERQTVVVIRQATLIPFHGDAKRLENQTAIVRDGRLVLGTWQGIYLCEHRNRAGGRRIVVTLQGT